MGRKKKESISNMNVGRLQSQWKKQLKYCGSDLAEAEYKFLYFHEHNHKHSHDISSTLEKYKRVA